MPRFFFCFPPFYFIHLVNKNYNGSCSVHLFRKGMEAAYRMACTKLTNVLRIQQQQDNLCAQHALK